MAAHKTIADLVHADKWDDGPVEVWVDLERAKEFFTSDGIVVEMPPAQALELSEALADKARLALAGKYEHHYEGENGEEID
ncbi:hypothetical protein Q7F20_07550 [Curtobacterium sp. A7_M15]|uniref:hypothetical protein n=1 Tax=Curtobacterium sp. A7_M15 TaxID=3065241 RepID=UPI002737F062|nr:hypothetical protein [Curtobacterium sp. A7_M15]MDP4333223.1 hypothetical protein [Curtobacterium sp. A7_M15]